MFKHSGSKLKIVAYVLAILGAFASIVLSMVMVAMGNFTFLGRLVGHISRLILAVGIVVFGLLLSWVVGLAVYGFGELIEKTKESEYMLTRIAAHSKEMIEYISQDNKPDA